MTTRKVGECDVLPLRITGTPSFTPTVLHYLYLRPHEPKVPSPNSERSLFLANIPIDANGSQIRSLFAQDILGNARVESVEIGEVKSPSNKDAPSAQRGRKRKRQSHDSMSPILPAAWDRTIHPSGSTAVVVFADTPNMKAAHKAVRKLTRTSQSVPWPASESRDRIASLGSARYKAHHALQFPDRTVLQTAVDTFMTAFGEAEQARKRAAARLRQEPDADGFITVTRGARVAPKQSSVTENSALRDSLEAGRAKAKAKNGGLGDFYRFQVREKKRAEAGDLVNKFQHESQDLRRLQAGDHHTFRPE